MRRKVTPEDVQKACCQKMMGVTLGPADFSEGVVNVKPPCKHVESKEVPWDTPLIEGE